MQTQWKKYLDQTRPPGAVVDFSAAAFVLQVAMNIRVLLDFVDPTAECSYYADRVIACAEIYGHAREAGSALPFSDAEKVLAETVTLFVIELQQCPPAPRAGDVWLARRRPTAASQPTKINEGHFGNASL
ncbi:hypothetical protein PY650_22875 [Rhizobium calliandrae]|uniref:DUF982 domain-containing protein n=1 Tax=Rhizobium calliandrae TaxID=1312182 RepID=A0ABT7KMG1_9HYPH|nr:hypothetical protein [Rhizobium calliandrae]MDL2408439.1 hypothetical protein [Rhizobium calliandrae]